jgi:hypothetical protein
MAFIIAGFLSQLLAALVQKMPVPALFIQGRAKESIEAEELASFPQSLGSIDINATDSSVTGSVLGFAKRKSHLSKRFGMHFSQ